MLILKHEMYVFDFEQEFKRELQDLPYQAIEIIFDGLKETMHDGDYTVLNVRDYLRFQLQVMSLDEVIDSYGYDMGVDNLEGDALIEAVEDYLFYNTYLLGKYEEDGITYFIFDEF